MHERVKLPHGGLTLLSVGGGPQDGRGVEAGGVFAVAVVAPAVEDDGGYAGPGDEVEDGAEYGVRPLLVSC